jgi:two-component system sensor histidine kinase BaeS
MQLKIGHRLFFGFLFSAFVVLTVSSALTRWNFQRGFLNYVNESEADRLDYLAATLAHAYGEQQSWAPLTANPDRWIELMGPPASETAQGRPREWVGRARGSGVVSEDPLAISPRVSVLDRDGTDLFGPLPSPEAQVKPIVYRGQIVGSLHLNPLETLADDLAMRFSEEQTRWIFGTALTALLLATALAVVLTRQIVRPVTALARCTRALAAGRFTERIQVTSSGELAELARDFNSLAETLERNQHAQRLWIADISHELRTPLTILRAELHAVDDGVRELDETTRKSLASEVERLNKLVNDLYELALSEVGALRYQKETANVVDVLRDTVGMFESSAFAKNLRVHAQYPSEPLNALIDVHRLGQLFTNVLENCVRYTDSGGEIRVSCSRLGPDILVTFDDSAPSVPDEALPRLCDRLYRVEESRSRSTGGAGLGLAICENIARAHGGRISVARSELGGLRVQLLLPADAQADN